MKIERKDSYKNFEIDVKRFYIPFKVTIICEGCGEEVTRDFGDDYISYPQLGDSFEEYIYHWEKSNGEECDTETLVKLKLDLNLSIEED